MKDNFFILLSKQNKHRDTRGSLTQSFVKIYKEFFALIMDLDTFST